MISEWRVVESEWTGVVDVQDLWVVTVQHTNGRVEKLNSWQLEGFCKILGVVPLSHRLMAISEVSRAEQKALNLLDIDFRYLRDRSTNEWLGNYVYGEVLQEMSVNFLDLIYSSLHEETSQALSKLNKIGTAKFYADTGYDNGIYRSTYKVSDLAKFELAYTKYKILQR
jgi:hypothetical protein